MSTETQTRNNDTEAATSVEPMMSFRPGALGGKKRPAGSLWLRAVLVFIDTEAIFLAWAVALVFFQQAPISTRSSSAGVMATVVLVLVGLFFLATQDLYLARVSNIRAVEMTRLFRTSVLTALAAGLGAEIFDQNIFAWEAFVGGLLMLVFLVIGRSAYRAWLTARRTQGEYRRSVVLVGTNDEAAGLHDLLRSHVEIGLEVAAVFGDAGQAEANGLGHLYSGSYDEAAEYVTEHTVSGVLIATSSLPSPRLNRVVRDLLTTGTHIQLTSGLHGIASRRLRAQPLAHEPMIYLEQLTLSRWQLAVKRSIDIVASAAGLIVTGPVILVTGLIVKATSPGPMFFTQDRVGRNGEIFKMVKIRTMVVDAEARLAELKAAQNERRGPLFKMDRDPRFTAVGRILDVTSINELPQLWNVLKGDMSLVGPRPALPSEVADFDPELHSRNLVRPGITGLWQVEARDNPDFSAYRRLDLHYVENWSVTFDLVIMLQTAEAMLGRLFRALGGRTLATLARQPETPSDPDPASADGSATDCGDDEIAGDRPRPTTGATGDEPAPAHDRGDSDMAGDHGPSDDPVEDLSVGAGPVPSRD